MLRIAIPGFATLQLKYLVLDYNGTLAVDGKMLPGVEKRLSALSRNLSLHILTADTFGHARDEVPHVRCKLSILPSGRQDRAKRAYVKRLGASEAVCIGNGRNDRLMLKIAALGIAVLQKEGAACEAVAASDLVVRDVSDALDLLANPLRLIATLRS